MDQGKVGGASTLGASTTEYAYARQLVRAYFLMLTAGCHRDDCTNANCRSNPLTQVLTATEAAIKSIYFATEAPMPLCNDLDEQQEQTPTSTEIQHLECRVEIEKELVSTPEQPHEDKGNQMEDSVPRSEELHRNKEELHPETSEAEMPKTPQLEGIIISQPLTATPTPGRKSTPQRRLSIAVQLDKGLNKNNELSKRPTVITRVVVQPKHKSVMDPAISLPDDVTTVVAETEAADIPVQQQQQQLTACKVSSPAKDMRQRRLSRPKEKLFDAIKRSFSRSKKTPLGSA